MRCYNDFIIHCSWWTLVRMLRGWTLKYWVCRTPQTLWLSLCSTAHTPWMRTPLMTHSRQVLAPLLAACNCNCNSNDASSIDILTPMQKASILFANSQCLDSNIEPDLWLNDRASSKSGSCKSVLVFVHVVHALLLVVLYSACWHDKC